MSVHPIRDLAPGDGVRGLRLGRVPRPRFKPVRRRLRFLAARASIVLVARTPRSTALWLMGAIGALAYTVMPRQRRLVAAQIDRVYPDRAPHWRRSLARQVFVETGRSAVDVARLSRPCRARLRAVLDLPPEARLAPLRRPDGAIVVSAHYGPWEILPSALAALGVRAWVIVRPNRERRIERLLERLRTGYGVGLVPRGADARLHRALLRSGGVLVLAGDQTPRGRRQAGRFLGLDAWIPSGPATLAVLCGVPVVPAVVRRTVDGRIRLVVAEPLEPSADADREESVRKLATRCADVLEREIAEDPSQWAWFHERWKSVPELVAGGVGAGAGRAGHARRV